MTAIPDQQAFGDYGEWPGRDVLDPAGGLLGGVVEIYLDDATDLPEWVLVAVGAGTPRFVPLADAKVERDAIRVAQPAERVEAAPAIDPRVELTQNQERELYAHYGLRYSEEESDTGLPAPPPERDEPTPAPRPRLRRHAAPETAAAGELPPEPRPIPPVSPLPPPSAPMPARRPRVPSVPPAAAAGVAAGLLALLLVLRRRRRR